MLSKSLRTWFVIHFAVDMLIGFPLLLWPAPLLRLFGWGVVDAFLARVVGAALMGIGWESLLGRDGGVSYYRGMLRLKLIWAGSAMVGMALSLLTGESPPAGWLFFGLFALFFLVWARYSFVLRENAAG